MKRMISFISLLMLSASILSACSLSTLSKNTASTTTSIATPSSTDTTNVLSNDNGSSIASSTTSDSSKQASGDGTAAAAKQPSKATNVKSSSIEYKVLKGDTFYKICKKFYTNSNKYSLLIKQNNIKDTSHIIAGETLIIPEPDKQ